MREDNLILTDEVAMGLRPYISVGGQGKGLSQCFNVKPDPVGLVPYVPITAKNISITVDWPFPQLFIGSTYRVMADKNTIYQVDASWAKTSKVTSVTTGGVWHWADFGDYFIMTNGSHIIDLDHGTIAAQNTPPTWTKSTSIARTELDIPRCGTYCNFNGQLIGGNVKSTWHSCGINHLVWSRIGNADMNPTRANEAGYKKAPWEGEIHKVISLGISPEKGVMVYGDNGILYMFPAEQTFGFRELSGVGIPSRGAAGGDNTKQVFVDSDDFLWMVGPDLQLNKLGYQEFMSKMTAANIVISHDKLLDEFYISDGSYGYLLTKNGLCQVFQYPTSVHSVDGVSYGTLDVDGGADAAKAKVCTGNLDFSLRGKKTVKNFLSGVHDTAGTLVGHVKFRDTINGAFQALDSVQAPDGVVYQTVSGFEFQCYLESSAYGNFNLDHMDVNYQVDDKRALRRRY
jgi:hypothetical protein